MGGVEKYIAQRKKTYSEFAEGFEDGYWSHGGPPSHAMFTPVGRGARRRLGRLQTAMRHRVEAWR